MAKYFDIHVKYDYRDCDGYSICVIADDEKDAVAVALNNNLFAEDGDERYIDNVTEVDYVPFWLSKDEFDICCNYVASH